jgi:hypothetical protein
MPPQQRRSAVEGTSAHAERELEFPPANIDARIAATIADGGGIATAAQLRDAGVHRNAIVRRLDAGVLIEVVEHVFAYPQDDLLAATRRRAAVLSCGEDARASHHMAAAHRELLQPDDDGYDELHVVVPRERNPRRKTISVHRVDTLEPADLDEHLGLPCTSVSRIMLDLAGVEPRRRIERICDEAAYLGLWRKWEIEELLGRAEGHRGAATLRAVLREHVPGTTRTTNELEEAFLAICDAQRWPRPVCQLPDRLSNGRRIVHDFIWRDLRLIVETDGGRGHRGAKRRTADARRDADLRARRYTVLRFTWFEVFHRPERVIAQLAPLFADGNVSSRAA